MGFSREYLTTEATAESGSEGCGGGEVVYLLCLLARNAGTA